jgi:phage recombination protein Bet
MENQELNQTINEARTITKAEMLDKPIIYRIDDEEVKLTPNIVRKYLVRGNAPVTDEEILSFMNLCKYQKLNPFLNEAYIIKFQGDNPVAQIVTAKEFFLKRAQDNPDYDGIQAGLIVIRDGKMIDLEGAVKLPTDEILGGWAVVYSKKRKYPSVSRVLFSEYNKGKSVWKDKPMTMIRKVAEAQALREAFPKDFNGLYIEEENAVVNTGEVVETVKKQATEQTASIKPQTSKPADKPIVADEIEEIQ